MSKITDRQRIFWSLTISFACMPQPSPDNNYMPAWQLAKNRVSKAIFRLTNLDTRSILLSAAQASRGLISSVSARKISQWGDPDCLRFFYLRYLIYNIPILFLIACMGKAGKRHSVGLWDKNQDISSMSTA